MYLKLKTDIGVGEFLLLAIEYITIMIAYGLIVGAISGLVMAFGLDVKFTIVYGIVSGILSPLLVLGLFIYTIKFVIDSIFIIPASDYEKKNIIENEEK